MHEFIIAEMIDRALPLLYAVAAIALLWLIVAHRSEIVAVFTDDEPVPDPVEHERDLQACIAEYTPRPVDQRPGVVVPFSNRRAS